MQYRVSYITWGVGVREKWFDSRIKAVIFRLFRGWVNNGFQTREEVNATEEYLRSQIKDYELTDGRY